MYTLKAQFNSRGPPVLDEVHRSRDPVELRQLARAMWASYPFGKYTLYAPNGSAQNIVVHTQLTWRGKLQWKNKHSKYLTGGEVPARPAEYTPPETKPVGPLARFLVPTEILSTE